MKDQPGIFNAPETKVDSLLNGSHQTAIIETPAREIEELFEKLEAYSKTTFELAKLKSLDVTTNVVTSLVSKLAVVIAAAFFLLFFSLGVSIWLGEMLERSYYGYYIVAVFYLVIALVFLQFLQPFIRRTLGQAIINQALE